MSDFIDPQTRAAVAYMRRHAPAARRVSDLRLAILLARVQHGAKDYDDAIQVLVKLREDGRAKA